MMNDDAVDELNQERSGEGVDVAVVFEVLDEVVRFVRDVGIGKGCLEVVDARL